MEKKSMIIIILIIIILGGGGFIGYRYFKAANEEITEINTTKDESEEAMIHYTNATIDTSYIYEGESYKNDKITLAIEDNEFVFTSVHGGKTYVSNIAGLSGALKYFTYTCDQYFMIHILVLTEEGDVYFGYIGDPINISDEKDFSIEDIVFEKVKTNKKVVDITRKPKKEYRRDMDVLCIKEKGEKLKGLFWEESGGEGFVLKNYEEVYPWEQYFEEEEFYIYKDGSIQMDFLTDAAEERESKFIVDENKKKVYSKAVFVNYTEAGYRNVYIVGKNNKLYLLVNTKLSNLDAYTIASDGNATAKLVNSKTVKDMDSSNKGFTTMYDDDSEEYDDDSEEFLSNVITFTDDTTFDIEEIIAYYVA